MTEISRYAVEMRAEVSGNKLVGHAAVFNQVADLGPQGYERMAPTAFNAVLADPRTDVRALFNHDPNQLLGRQSSGTLRISVDSEGLPFEVDLPNTSAGRDVRELAERGDLTGASFAFVPGAQEWQRSAGGVRVRNHTSVKRLLDVSPVTYPAYGGASIALRHMDLGLADSRSQLIRARARITLGRN